MADTNFREMIRQPATSTVSRLGAARRTLAADVSRLVARKLKEARKARGHSLDALAKASGVSRAMLGQIETGKSVPTITVMWRIASALGVPVADLISEADATEPVVLTRANSKTAASLDGGYAERPIAPKTGAVARFFELHIEPLKEQNLKGRGEGLTATLVVAQGLLAVQVGRSARIILNEGDALVFDADSEHAIANLGTHTSISYLVLTDRCTQR